MFGMKPENLLSTLLIGICVIALIYSFAKYGYFVWFNPEDFKKLDEEKKRSSPQWLKIFTNSTTVLQDLWIVRIAYLVICIIVLFSLALFLMRTF